MISVVALGVFFTTLADLNFSLYCESTFRVVSSGKLSYALTIDRELNYRTYQSNDGGLHWLQVTDTPDEIEADLYSLDKNFEPICHPQLSHLCYRISEVDKSTGSASESLAKLEQSINGGDTWHEIKPPFTLTSMPGCADSYPKSVTFLEVDELKGAYNLIVAVNSGGILVYFPGGEWLQKEIKPY